MEILNLLKIKTNFISNGSGCIIPIPYRDFLFYKKIIRPPFIQRFNIPSACNITDEVFKYLRTQYRSAVLHLNNDISTDYVTKTSLINLCIPLHDNYEVLYSRYNDSHKRIINRINKNNNLTAAIITIDQFISFASKHTNTDIPRYYRDFSKFRNLFEVSIASGKAMVYGVFNNDQQIVAACYFMWRDNRLQYLYPVSNPEGKQNNAMHYLVDKLITEYSNSDIIFDFCGSNIPSIATFMQRFGSKQEHYFAYTW